MTQCPVWLNKAGKLSDANLVIHSQLTDVDDDDERDDNTLIPHAVPGASSQSKKG